MKQSFSPTLLGLVVSALLACSHPAIEPPPATPRYTSLPNAIKALGADTASLLFIVDGVIVRNRDSLPEPATVQYVEVIRATAGHCLEAYMVKGQCPIVLALRLRRRTGPA